MRHSNSAPKVNAGSMADIAFLLLIFFLVTTTIPNDVGIFRKLPTPCPEGQICDADIYERNILRIYLNNEGQLFVNQNVIIIQNLRSTIKDFIDNNGDVTCNYCHGSNSNTSSDNPQLAIISLSTDTETPYAWFIAIQNELTGAYYELREDYVTNVLKKDIAALSKEELKKVKEAYPFRISEAEVK